MKLRIPAWLRLAIICIAVGGMLGIVNSITVGPIAQRALEAANASRYACFPGADAFEELALPEGSTVDGCYAAMQNGSQIGYVTQVTVTGFGGPVEIHVGMDLEGTITGISVGGSKFSETPGLGAKSKEPAFTGQFTGLTIPVQVGNNVDAITGATITSGAVCSGVNKAGYFVRDLLNTSDSTTEHEAVSVDYGKVTELAKAEFAKVFKEFEDVQIEETATMARTDDAQEIVVQFKYSSGTGNGVYGFLYNLDDYANPELVQHGKEITIDNLLG